MEVKSSTSTPILPIHSQPVKSTDEHPTEPIPTSIPPASKKNSSKYQILKEVKDWMLAVIFLTWGVQGIYDRNFKPNPNDENFQAIIKILDKNGDGKVSKEEIEEAKKMIEEVKKWKNITDAINGFTGKK